MNACSPYICFFPQDLPRTINHFTIFKTFSSLGVYNTPHSWFHYLYDTYFSNTCMSSSTFHGMSLGTFLFSFLFSFWYGISVLMIHSCGFSHILSKCLIPFLRRYNTRYHIFYGDIQLQQTFLSSVPPKYTSLYFKLIRAQAD